jgi:hypothetical protein
VSFVAVRAAARTADFLAVRAGVRWAIELRTSSRPLQSNGAFVPIGAKPLPYPDLESYFALTWREKRGQLESTMAAEDCARGLLLIAVEGKAGPAWASALKRAWESAGRPAAIAFGVLSARAFRTFPPTA